MIHEPVLWQGSFSHEPACHDWWQHQKTYWDLRPNVHSIREVLTQHSATRWFPCVMPTLQNVNSPSSSSYFKKFSFWIDTLGLLGRRGWKTVPDKSFLFPNWLGEINKWFPASRWHQELYQVKVHQEQNKLQASFEPGLVSCPLYSFLILLIHIM